MQFNQDFHNLLFRGFYETKIHKKIAKKYSKTRARNIRITGYPGLDNLLLNKIQNQDPWKNTKNVLKKIIWAPHHTIDDKSLLCYSNFLSYHDDFIVLSEKYRNEIQIAFKPHPLLKPKLYEHSEWGKIKTDCYYEKWQNLENGQLALEDYIDLFLTSDGMIHDSGSFLVEYLSTSKPALFVMRDTDIRDRFNDFGKLAFENHYHANNFNDIEEFITNVVLENNDILYKQRKIFIKTHLSQNTDKTASEKIYMKICKLSINKS